MELIPGLPNDLARQCLIRLPFESFPSLLSVSKAWNSELRNPDFHQHRRLSGHARPVFILADVSERHNQTRRPRLLFELAIFEPGPESFTYLPGPPPSLPGEFSGFIITGIVGVGTTIFVILYVTKERSIDSLNLIFVFDLLTGQWRRGADLPAPGRTLHGLAGDPFRRKVLVAGGYGYGGQRLKSAFLYDVATDSWLHLADMGRSRIECSAVFHAGKFHVISGRSKLQARPFIRMTCAESLDPDTLQWSPIDDEFLEASASDYHWVMGNGEGHMYQMGQNVTFRRGTIREWQLAAEVPHQLQEHMTCGMTWRDKMVVIGRTPHAYVLDLISGEWTHRHLPYQTLYRGCGMDL